MKKAGCTAINYGVESVDPEVPAKIAKDIALDQVDKTIRLTREAGIKANVFLMVGNPGDTTKVFDKMNKFVERVKVDGVHLGLATPIRGTEFWSWAYKNGDWLGYDREELLDWPVDDVEDAYTVFETPDFTAKQRIEISEKQENISQKRNYSYKDTAKLFMVTLGKLDVMSACLSVRVHKMNRRHQ
jgi:histone acetyltransferase (RNA polymerase elongator complex component)